MFNEHRVPVQSEYPIARSSVREVLEKAETQQPAGTNAQTCSQVANPEESDVPLPLRTALERVAVHHRIKTIAVFAQIDRLTFMETHIHCDKAWVAERPTESDA
ncbi:MAG: hypothetical protein ACLPVY_13900 [Acidimicrobiia bacterium]